MSKNSKTFFNTIEVASWLICTCIYFTFYNPVGELGKQRGVDYSDWVHPKSGPLHWLEVNCPLIPWMVFPYIAVYAMPFIYPFALIAKYGWDMGKLRRFYLTQMILITVAFTCYYLFPVQTNLLWDEETQSFDIGGDSWIHELNFKFVHQGISFWVACPSMHTAHSWSIAFAFTQQELPLTRLMQFLAAITIVSTLTTRAHHPPHVGFGIILAVLGHLVMQNMAQQKLFEKTNEKVSPWIRFYAATLAPLAFLSVGQHLHNISGWKTDIPAMFGFESNPVLGLYGF